MPTYKITLSDGRVVTLEAASKPSEADVMAAIGGNQTPPRTPPGSAGGKPYSTEESMKPSDSPQKVGDGFWSTLGHNAWEVAKAGFVGPGGEVIRLEDVPKEGALTAAFKELHNAYDQGGTLGAVRAATGMVPVIGPQMQRAQDMVATGNLSGAAAEALSITGPMAAGLSAKARQLPAEMKDSVEGSLTSNAARKAVVSQAKSISDLIKAYNAKVPAETWNTAAPAIVAENAVKPIKSSQDLVEAATSQIVQNEEKVAGLVKQYPNEEVLNPARQAVMKKASQLAQSGVDMADIQRAVAELERRGMFSKTTIPQMDAWRKTLGAENDGVLSQPGTKIAQVATTDPMFALREAAASSFRNSVYDELAKRGNYGVRSLRDLDGALIEIRDVARSYIDKDQSIVPQTGSTSTVTRAARQGLTVAGTLGGYALGEYMGGGHMGGAGLGVGAGVMANQLGDLIHPRSMSRGALLERSIGNLTSEQGPRPMPSNAGLLPAAPIRLGPSPDTSSVRGVPAEYGRELQRLAAPEARPMGPSPDISSVRGVSADNATVTNQRLLDQGGTRLPYPHPTIDLRGAPTYDASSVGAIPARTIVIRDPNTGRFRRIFTTEGVVKQEP